MRTSALIATVAAAALLTAPANAEPPKDKADESANKIKELQKERITALKEVAEQSIKLALASRLEFKSALDARMALLKAELDVAETDADRVALYKGALESLKKCEAMAKALHESGRGTDLDVHKAKAARLEIEIELERVKGKDAKERK